MVVAAAPWEDVLGGVDDARLVHLTREPARDARVEPYPADLDPRLQSALIAQGVTALYGHQARAWEAARAGRHVCIVTGTASGKSLAFNLPVVAGLLEQPGSRALYVYPAKALAQDQARALAAFRGRLRPLVYDGDTPRNRRAMVRRFGNPVITNPDMLHIGLLPNHPRWAEFLAGLTHVVVDEAHAYRGVFGSHVACVLRRLRRVCALYGSEPQFLLASATVANPAEAAAALTGLEVEVIDEDTAPRAERTVAFWQPILLDEASGERASALGEAAVLLATLVGRGLRTICFTKSRKGTELVYRLARDRLAAAGLEEAAERLAPYRAGYTAEVRRAIEADLVSGALLGVVATEALELGIDVGLLDCAITTGFPGTVASLRQQWGRAGRRDAGLAVFVPSEDGLDQFFARHPEALLERRVEAVIMDAANPEIRLGHVRAAADEVPITPADDAVLGPGAHETALELAAAGELLPSPAGLVWRGGGSPAAAVPLRSVGTATVVVVEAGTGAMLGTVDEMRAVSTLHDGAVYLHRGESYLVERLDLDEGVALVAPFDGRWYTQPRRETDTRILRRLEGPAPPGRSGPLLRRGRGHRSRGGVPAARAAGPRLPRQHRARPPRAALSHPRPVVRAAGDGAGRVPLAPGRPARGRAHPHLGAPPVRHVRPLGHRGPVHQPARADRRPGGVHLRGPPRRGGADQAGRGRLRGPCGRRLPHRPGVPVRERLPVLRAVAQVREPQRDAGQGRRGPAAQRDAPASLSASSTASAGVEAWWRPSRSGPTRTTTGRPILRARAISESVPQPWPMAIAAWPEAATARFRPCPAPVATTVVAWGVASAGSSPGSTATTSPPAERAPREAASITPPRPPVTRVAPASARRRPTSSAAAASSGVAWPAPKTLIWAMAGR